MCFTTRNLNAKVEQADHDIPILKVFMFIDGMNVLASPVIGHVVQSNLKDVESFTRFTMESGRPIELEDTAADGYGVVNRYYTVEEGIHCYDVETMVSERKVKRVMRKAPLIDDALTCHDKRKENFVYVFKGYIPKGTEYITDSESCACVATEVVIEEIVDIRIMKDYDDEKATAALARIYGI